MIERTEAVPYGRAASEALAAAIARSKRRGPLAPVTVVVPSNLAGLTARRLLGAGEVGGGGIANVSFLTPFRLAELLSTDLLLDRRPLTNPVLGAAVRLALAADPTGPYAAVAQHVVTETAIAALYAELSNVSAGSLDRLAREGGPAARTAVRLHHAVESRLGGFHDEADVARAAATRPDLAEALTAFGDVVWYLPQPATRPLTELLGAVAARAPTTVIVGVTGAGDTDAPVWATCEAAGVTRPEPRDAAPPPVAGRIVSVTDADEEVRAVVRGIVELAEQGVALHRIGVFHPTPDPYVATLEQQLAAAGIPANGPSRRRLADGVAGRTLLAALALPEQRWRRDKVMAVVSGGPVRHGDGPVRPAVWEALSRNAGVVRDLADWRRKLEGSRAALQGRIRRCDPADERVVGRLQREAADVEQLGAFVDDLATAVAAVERASGWSARCEAARALLHHLLGPGHLHPSWPEHEQVGFERVEDALVRLATLDELEPAPTHAVFVRALTAELDVARGRAGRFGEGVFYGPLASAAGHDLAAVFVLGCAEGICPSPRREDSLLPDDARALAAGELELRAARLGDQHRSFLAALAAAPAERRVLTFARGDLRSGRGTLPSRWLLDSASALASADAGARRTIYTTDFEQLRVPGIDVVPSFASGLVTAATHASVDERDLAVIRGAGATALDAAEHPAAADVRRGLQAQAARRSEAFTEWDGNLAGQPIPTTADRPLSPSRLESWAACGYRYFLAHVLGLGERDDPERVLELGALDRGSGVHTVLERFLLEVLEAGVPDPDEPWSEQHREQIRAIAEEVFADYEARGRTGRSLHWRIAKPDLLVLLDEFLDADDRYRSRERCRPVRVELPFGLEGVDPVRLSLADGRTLAFRGRADRVDRADDDRLLVSDYKTGRGTAYAGIDDGDPVNAGTTLQLGLYAEAAVQHLGAASAEAHYWMVDARARYARHGYAWDDARRARFLEVLGAVVDGIEGGVFPVVPGEWDDWRRTHETCTYCAFDAVCSKDRGEHAAVKVEAPELRVRDRLEWEGEE